jgi:serine protease AprX
MKKLLIVFLLASIALANAADAGNANASKLSPDLQKYSATHARVLVQYNRPPGVLDLGIITKLLGSVISQLPLINGIVADLPLANILSLSNQENVKYISLDRALKPTLSNAAPAVNAFAAWQSGYTGAGIGVALIDSGVNDHPDLHGGLLGLSRVV